MFNIYKTNRIEVISELLAKELIISPPLITEKIDIAIPNYFFGKWLRDQITLSNQISALYELKTISNFTEVLLGKFLPGTELGLWNFESIKWAVLDSLEELNTYEESFPISNWINKYLDNQKIIDGDIYNLAKKIANNFVNYLTFRPEMISDWNRYELYSPRLFNNLNLNEFWQPILYKLIEKRISGKPSCLYMMDIVNNFKKFKNYNNIMPRQIYIISDNNLSKLQLNFYLKVADLTKVNLYILSAGDNFWSRINTVEGEVNFRNEGSQLYLSKINIEKIFGQFGGNYQKLIEENTNVEEIILNNNSIYIDPTISLFGNNDNTLLNQIQKKLIDNNKLDLIIKSKDDSIIFKGHLNQLSQLEYIRKKIIELLEFNNEIKYSDIAIVTPKSSIIRPYLKYIFNNEIINGEKIPYFFVEEYKENSDLCDFLLDITEIANEKFTLDVIESFLSKISTQHIYDFDISEKDEVICLLKDLGFHWGVDTNERLGEEKNTLDWCINRIILGLIYDEKYTLPNSSLQSFNPKNSSLDINKWVEILIHIKTNINLLRGSFDYLTWVKKIKFIIKNIKIYNQNIGLEISKINRLLDEYSSTILSKKSIVLNVFREVLISCINKIKYINQSSINKILIGDIEKIRLIPHKVTFLINMNSIYYPKIHNNENINLLNKKHLLGDPSDFDREKYFFIELLISCRSKLIVSWIDYDNDNKKLDISFPIKQLINFFEGFLNEEQKKSIIQYYDYEQKRDIDINLQNNLETNYALVDKFDLKEEKFDSQIYKLSELIYWFKSPQLYWLNKKNISPKGTFIHYQNDELVSNFQKYRLITSVFDKFGIDSDDIIDQLKSLNISDRLVENGIIAPKNSIFIKENEIKDLIDSLVCNLNEHHKINRIYVKSKSNKEEYFISDNVIIELIHSNLNLNRLSEAWIKLLFISALDKKISKTKIIFRKDNQYKSEIIQSPGPLNSKRILEEYINIFMNYSELCFPLPPESTYKYVEAKLKLKDEKKAFSERWIGNKNFIKGERDNMEMQICFGNKKDSEFFFRNDIFDNLSFKIYGPLIDSLKK